MKKFFLFAVAAVAVLASCSKNEPQVAFAQADDGAIAFGAYTSTAATKGSVVPVSDVIDLSKGIGIFAFYQPSTPGKSNNFNTKYYATPDFMYNQQVKPHAVEKYETVADYNAAKGTNLDEAAFNALTDAQKAKSADYWVYNPVKYWPNNSGDLVSFFAYAPYDGNKTWESMGIATDINATKMTVTFPIYDVVADQKDYLWATPAVNKAKPNVEEKINFAFTHILSQINLYAAAEKDDTQKKPAEWTDDSTVITINKVEFKDLAQNLEYSYALPAGTIEAGYPKATGKQDIVLTADEDFENNTSAAWTDDKFHKFNKATSVMFVAPQALSEVVITYTVKTTDPDHPANSSEITNVIKATPALTLEAGKAYNINFLIGMTSVKVDVTVKDWVAVADTQINVPANTPVPTPEP